MYLTKITESDARITVFAPSIGLKTAILAFSSALCATGVKDRLPTFAPKNHKPAYS